jgi:ectoine hydroxylase-related dioxygenase (phytanoyl-CoA dioxygenase family)
MKVLPSIFKDKGLQRLFEINGFVIVDLFDSTQVLELTSIYNEIPKAKLSFESTSFIDNTELLLRINQKVEAIFKEPLQPLLIDHKKLGTSFLTKMSNQNSVMPIHQDWTVVDESMYCSVTCWAPLVDTNIQNGALQLIPGSHFFSHSLRSPSLPIAFDNIYKDLKPFLKTMPLKSGQAIFFNHALWHASHSNLSGENRVAVTYGFTQKDADLCMYYYSNGKLEKWSMPDDMFLHYSSIRTTPKIGKKMSSNDYDVKKITVQQVGFKSYKHRKENKMKPLFLDKSHQEEFELKGYLKLPALGESEIADLRSFYQSLNLIDNKGYGFHVGMDNKDKELVSKMVNTIKSIALPKIQPYLVENQLFTASFVVKEPNPQGVVPPHQDWSFVEDEENFCSVTCWIPLQDVSIENGCIGLINGSHHFFDAFRASPSPQVGTPLKEHMFTIFPFLELVQMKAGEALIFNNKTIHASPPNTTSESRLAIGLGFTQKEASICHYYLKPGSQNTVLKYKIDSDFFLKYDNANLSKMFDEGRQIQGYGTPEEVVFEFEKLSSEDFTQRIIEAGNTYNGQLVNAMANLFNGSLNDVKREEVLSDEKNKKNEFDLQNNPIEKQSFWKIYTPKNVFREIKHRLNL